MGARGWEGNGSCWCVVTLWEDEKALEMDGGDGRTAMEMYLMPLNCTQKELNWKILSHIFTTIKQKKR